MTAQEKDKEEYSGRQNKNIDDFELPESQKYKLTVGVDREIVRRAKAMGINISGVTELILRIITYKPTEVAVPYKNVVKAYWGFFDNVSNILKKHEGTEVEIGNYLVESEITKSFSNSNVREKIKVGEFPKPEKVRVTITLSPGHFLHHVHAKEGQLVGQFIGPSTDVEEINEKNIIKLLNNPWLYSPEKILKNLLSSITRTSDIKKNETMKVERALRILRAIFYENNNGDST